MKAQDIKNSILQLAIQGKLVEQRAEEGTAKELLEKIAVEKKQLILEGKIKKQKALPAIKEDEIPFDIPEKWEWVRLSEIIDVRDGTHDTPKYVANGIPLVTSKNLKQGEIDFDNVKLISLEESKKINMRSGVDDGDILLAMIGSIGNPVLVKKTREFSIKNMALFKPIKSALFNMEYLLNFLQLEQERMKRKAAGGVQSFVSLTFLRNYLVPLPPLEEQKRIVSKIEELMPYVEKYNVAYSEVEKLNKKFPEDMQKSILQYAIQGKLVEQRKEDGTAEELYQQIQEEKKKLIEEGKIKKAKALSEITEDEIPFDIPESWKWVRLGNLLNKLTDGTHSTPKYTVTGVPFISVKDVSGGKMDFSNTKFISQEEHDSLYKRCNPERDDILLTKVGTTGIPVIVDSDQEFSLFVSVALLKFNTDLIFNKYFMYAIKAPVVQIQARENTRGVGNKNWVMRDIANTILPLPPLNEQKRIVDELEKLLPYTKQLVK
ncbi:restriction endonuclease subunit S [Acetobacterium sp. UBA5834]|jgi:type I restriction enzyme S subunit|uniref:restriction endonuclease subunit S n=1 Tax=Acetobacterium sp. UBA5834 TaxID=1945907 RepID=UPI002579B55E|nr:restriction endonuclease subunit S [Acetobacterium sp. UBA5834]